MSALQDVTLTAQTTGRPHKLTPETADAILKHLSNGNYIQPSVEAAGISFQTFRTWIARGEQDKAQGKTTVFSDFLERLTHAQAAAEATLVTELRNEQDWRAKSFLLERRHRSRWGKDEQPAQAGIVLQVPEALASVLADALRVASATIVIPSTEVEQASAPLAIEAEPVPAQEILEPEPVVEQLPDRAVTTVKARRR